ncbi:NUDIX hydrolase domain-like protein [Boeremia exigua]|uniref:NUDIX hydrolase domain-like protein n=1 Tax=Boeremia exigua TaxID=749465 RepID=UPI001E8D57DA|nr:NUDIX hydrolase domain-like protein [Boeremia exigua]KAH6611933.1 NUDIX hydrolase domain-like protein [Boeremia exigua]
MSVSMLPFDSTSLQQYAIPESEYLSQHHDVHVICTGAVVFNNEGKLLLVQRAKDEKAYPDAWEIPGGKMDDTDETILHAAARELKEETGLVATRVVRKVTQFTFADGGKKRAGKTWLKLVFQFEVDNADAVVLDPIEHQRFLWACEEEITNDLVKEGSTPLNYISPTNKDVKLEAFKLQREAVLA